MSNVLSQFSSEILKDAYRNLIEESYEITELGRDIAYEESESYRGFAVADVACAILPGSSKIIQIARANFKHIHLPENDTYDEEHDLHDQDLFGENFLTDDLRDIPKVCAEVATIIDLDSENDYPELAASTGLIQIDRSKLYFPAHVTIGTTDEQLIYDVTKRKTKTLTPCADPCTPALDKSPNTSSSTLYFSSGLDNKRTQIRKMRNLKDLYRNGDESNADIPVFDLNPSAVQNALDYYTEEVQHVRYAGRKDARLYSHIVQSAFRHAAKLQ